MNGNFKTCPKGHYYSASLPKCPYCPGGAVSASTSAATSIQSSGSDEGHTVDISMAGTMQNGGATASQGTGMQTRAAGFAGGNDVANHTMFVDQVEGGEQGGSPVLRSSRKLVGWLVSYTIDEMGVDFRLYEGRNDIGRKMECQISVQDPTMTSLHAVVLFRAGKFSIKDQQSSQGTFVNNEDIELDARYLNDGDIIRMGQTVFKFRSAL